jgi:predicted component of viral defense system (DUF524 family)
MIVHELIIPISTTTGDPITLSISSNAPRTLFQIEINEAFENGESPWQLQEGRTYDFKVDKGYRLSGTHGVIQANKYQPWVGTISPNVYVGTLVLDIIVADTDRKCCEVKLEVQSEKTNYREDYRLMLEEITDKCMDLLLQHSSPTSQHFEVDTEADANTLYQRFAFIKSIIESTEFKDAIHKVTSAPVTRWKDHEVLKDIRGVKRFRSSTIRQIGSASNRIDLPLGHSLKGTISSIPSRMVVNNKTETVDTPENRFIKYALVSFASFCNDLTPRFAEGSRTRDEVTAVLDQLDQLLSHSIFRDIASPTTLPLNSPVLQRKEGYREVLRVWLMFDLAAKIAWRGGDDVYSGNKRDVATLYEYWLFFKLLSIVKEIFKIQPMEAEELIEQTSDGLGIKLRQGRYLPISGVYLNEIRNLHVQFCYNRTFSGNNTYPNGGSWSRNLRPDYTLSIWPEGIDPEQAEREELIVHIHFDAKYKVENLHTILGKGEDLDREKEEERTGTYKRADILKMHTYRDAIRRTAGAYVLYPGFDSDNIKGFHEILPGLGAFPMRPSKTDDGSHELKSFLGEVLTHFLNRASQREKISLKTYETYKDDKSNEVYDPLPETYGDNRTLIPDETYVLVGYYREDNWDWIIRTGLYNARADSRRGSLRLGPGEAGAKYLLLHTEAETVTSKLFKITETGPRVFSKQTLITKGYPNPSQDYYLVYKVKEVNDPQFLKQRWDIRQLEGYQPGRNSALPFAVTMTELMKVKVK